MVLYTTETGGGHLINIDQRNQRTCQREGDHISNTLHLFSILEYKVFLNALSLLSLTTP